MSETVKTIVIGTALTPASDSIVRTGVAIARAAGSSPWLIHGYMPTVSTPELDARWLEQQAEALRAELADQARRTGLTGLSGFRPAQLRLVVGSPAREILDLASQVQADLIIVGATEGGALHRILLGSTADSVIRKAPCPVLVLRSGSAFPPVRVEVPVDLSPISASCLRQGLSLLTQLGVSLTETEALFVLNPFEVGGSVHFTPAQIQRFATEELGRFLAANSPGEIPRLARVCTGYPREAILAALKERRADLAILGTHGRSGFERLTLGSVAAEVMHSADCNLLIVPPDAGLRNQELRGADWEFVSDEEPALAGEA
jgi:nucleotide-binding universal stress UspA family protein